MDIVHELIAHAPPPKVYAALTTPALLASWFTDQVETEADPHSSVAVGTEIAFRFRQGVIRVRVAELVPHQKVVWEILQGLPGWEGVTGTMTWTLTTPYPGTMIHMRQMGWPSMDGAYPSSNHRIGTLIDQMRALVEASEVEPA
ncbi:MAG TPA: SRPBCC domain-containing protein [Phototrophicaceae bacterium]|nr:SRPBCC domain-containing protein [Phototrophicaceae bacterium]